MLRGGGACSEFQKHSINLSAGGGICDCCFLFHQFLLYAQDSKNLTRYFLVMYVSGEGGRGGGFDTGFGKLLVFARGFLVISLQMKKGRIRQKAVSSR